MILNYILRAYLQEVAGWEKVPLLWAWLSWETSVLCSGSPLQSLSIAEEILSSWNKMLIWFTSFYRLLSSMHTLLYCPRHALGLGSCCNRRVNTLNFWVVDAFAFEQFILSFDARGEDFRVVLSIVLDWIIKWLETMVFLLSLYLWVIVLDTLCPLVGVSCFDDSFWLINPDRDLLSRGIPLNFLLRLFLVLHLQLI